MTTTPRCVAVGAIGLDYGIATTAEARAEQVCQSMDTLRSPFPMTQHCHTTITDRLTVTDRVQLDASSSFFLPPFLSLSLFLSLFR